MSKSAFDRSCRDIIALYELMGAYDRAFRGVSPIMPYFLAVVRSCRLRLAWERASSIVWC